MTATDVFEVLFDPGDHTCFAKYKKGTSVYPVFEMANQIDQGSANWINFYSINPLHPTRDLAPAESYHRPDRPRRASANVGKYRNFLYEIDRADMSLTDQYTYIQGLGLPWSVCVYSGRKSLHFIISLEQPCQDSETHRGLDRRIRSILTLCDPSTTDAARLSRAPNVVRHDTNKLQGIVGIRARVQLQQLEAFIEKHPSNHIPEPKLNRLSVLPRSDILSKLATISTRTLSFLTAGSDPGTRHDRIIDSVLELVRKGFEEEEILQLFSDCPILEDDFSRFQVEIEKAIHWALKLKSR